MRTLTLLALLLACTAFATEDTEENRVKEVERYLNLVPVAEMMSDITDSMSSTLPLDQQALLRKVMQEHFDVDLLTETMKDAMVRNFTLEEIRALADFYEQPVAKSAMEKSTRMMGEIMPVIQREAERAVQAALAQQEAANAGE
ncbi:MAG: DUF2059 domain-containing protein [Woeseiaceae bacterium]|nr:DUF2059 domain-containing protein [Woeseiaceae bacterium]